MWRLLFALAVMSCSSPASRDDGGADDGGRDGPQSPDAKAGADGQPAGDATAADAAGFDPGPEPTTVIRPKAGEVTVIQLALPIGIAVAMGEAAIVVGPNGTMVLIDVGNGSHDDDIREAVTELNTLYLTPEHGFPARSARQVEWIIATHFHGDHVGALADLLNDPSEPLQVTEGIVHRGFTDLGAAMNEADYEAVCNALRGPFADLDLPMCVPAEPAPCAVATALEPHPAVACPGLFLGDLGNPADDGLGQPSYISLGEGATLTLTAASAFVSDGVTTATLAPFGQSDSNEENARSIAGFIAHGQFRYHFGGDMTGSGDAGEPDVESLYATVSAPVFYGERGVDVAHAHHHARRTSSNATFVGALAPLDDASRNVVGGINEAYLGSPYQEVLDAWAGGDRLGGGRFWVTATTLGGGTHEALIDAAGPVILQTLQSGMGYRVQAAGAVLQSIAFPSVRL